MTTSRGTERAQKPNIDWPGLVFFGSAEEFPFFDIEFVTLKQRAADIVVPDAIIYCAEKNIHGDQEVLIRKYLLDHDEPITLKEFVCCHYRDDIDGKLRITVGVDVDVIDDEAEQKGLDLLAQMDTFNPGTYREFGTKEHTFTPWEAVA